MEEEDIDKCIKCIKRQMVSWLGHITKFAKEIVLNIIIEVPRRGKSKKEGWLDTVMDDLGTIKEEIWKEKGDNRNSFLKKPESTNNLFY